MLLHATVFDHLDHLGTHLKINVNVDEKVPRTQAVLIDCILQLSYLLLGALCDIVGLIPFALLLIFTVALSQGESLGSQAHFIFAIALLLRATSQLSHLTAAFACDFLRSPSARVVTGAPNLVFDDLFFFYLNRTVGNNVLVTKGVPNSSATISVMNFNLKVLVAVEILKVVHLVCSLSVVGISLVNLVGPLRYHLCSRFLLSYESR